MTEKETNHTLHDYVQMTVKSYLNQLDDQAPANLYSFVLTEVETALLKTVLTHTNGNQSKAATFLGINRGTLRKKLKEYRLNDLEGME